VANLWIDDERVPPVSWTANPAPHWARTSIEAINYLQSAMEWGAEYEVVSFDHDLGYLYEGFPQPDGTEFHPDRPDDTRRVLMWMVENDFWPKSLLLVHTMNPVGREWLLGTARRHAPSWVTVAVGKIR
jgi:hypothetical protein